MIVEVVSDFVCPWCWIGKRGLDALAREMPVSRHWRPYYLNPDLPPEGADRKTLMMQKFGPDGLPKAVAEALQSAADAVGIALNLDRIERVPHTGNAHRLNRWAAGQGVGEAVSEGLFKAYFQDGLDIGEAAVLLDLGEAAGMDRDVLAELLNSDADMDIVDRQAAEARDLGISGVPTYLIDRRGMVVGAQGVDALRGAVRKIRTV
nr:DsbA family oxidoreductase [Pacificimonas pallii]